MGIPRKFQEIAERLTSVCFAPWQGILFRGGLLRWPQGVRGDQLEARKDGWVRELRNGAVRGE